MRIIVVSALLGTLLSCDLTGTPPTSTVGECSIEATLSPAAAHSGDVVVIGGGPFTQRDDTIVRVNGVAATLSDLARTDCELCDACISGDATCRCGECATCEAACLDCTQSVSFVVPELPAGATTVVLLNRYGSTAEVALAILAAPADTDGDTDTDAATDTDTDTP